MSGSPGRARWQWGLGLVVALGFGFYLHQREVEQRERFERLEKQLTALNEALLAVKRAPAAAPLAPAALPPEAPRGGVDLVATEALARRVAELVGEQLQAHPAASSPPESHPEPPPPASREQRAALELARRTLDGALSRGRLSREDVETMRQQLAVAQDPEALGELRRRIIVAINTNALVPEDPRFIVP